MVDVTRQSRYLLGSHAYCYVADGHLKDEMLTGLVKEEWEKRQAAFALTGTAIPPAKLKRQ
jgi:hypothetical protein